MDPKTQVGDDLSIWSARQVTSRLGISRSQLYRMLSAGELPKRVRISAARWGWTRASLEQWVADRIEPSA